MRCDQVFAAAAMLIDNSEKPSLRSLSLSLSISCFATGTDEVVATLVLDDEYPISALRSLSF
jgi:hypothetical protein